MTRIKEYEIASRQADACGHTSSDGYECTRLIGHEGEHVATGSNPETVFRRWTQ